MTCCTVKGCRKQCCRIILGVVIIFLGILSLVSGALIAVVNEGDITDELSNAAPFWLSIVGGLWVRLS